MKDNQAEVKTVDVRKDIEEQYILVERKNKGKGKNKTRVEEEKHREASTGRPGVSQMFNCDLCSEIFLAEQLVR